MSTTLCTFTAQAHPGRTPLLCSSERFTRSHRRATEVPPPIRQRTSVPAPRRSLSPHRGVRLTRRGRLVVTTSCLVLALGVGLVGPWGSSVDATTAQSPGPTTARVTVVQGLTLWQIARDIAPTTDPRITVERILDLNGLPDSSVRAGQELVIPVA